MMLINNSNHRGFKDTRWLEALEMKLVDNWAKDHWLKPNDGITQLCMESRIESWGYIKRQRKYRLKKKAGRQRDIHVSVYTHIYIDIHPHIQISGKVFSRSFVCELMKCSEIPQISKLNFHTQVKLLSLLES